MSTVCVCVIFLVCFMSLSISWQLFSPLCFLVLIVLYLCMCQSLVDMKQAWRRPWPERSRGPPHLAWPNRVSGARPHQTDTPNALYLGTAASKHVMLDLRPLWSLTSDFNQVTQSDLIGQSVMVPVSLQLAHSWPHVLILFLSLFVSPVFCLSGRSSSRFPPLTCTPGLINHLPLVNLVSWPLLKPVTQNWIWNSWMYLLYMKNPAY